MYNWLQNGVETALTFLCTVTLFLKNFGRKLIVNQNFYLQQNAEIRGVQVDIAV